MTCQALVYWQLTLVVPRTHASRNKVPTYCNRASPTSTYRSQKWKQSCMQTLSVSFKIGFAKTNKYITILAPKHLNQCSSPLEIWFLLLTYRTMKRGRYLPEAIWEVIIQFAGPRVLMTLRKVSKGTRSLVMEEVQERWEDWRSKASCPVHEHLPLELGDTLDDMLFTQICSGKRKILFRAMNKYERMWIRAR